MSILFLCDNKGNIASAFTPEQAGAHPVMTFPEFKRAPIGGVEYIFSTWGMPSLSYEEIGRYFPRLKAVFYAAGSVQDFARPFLEFGARVFSAWGANAVPVAEFAASQILLANKGYFRAQSIYREKGFEAAAEYASHFGGNYFADVGLLGAGMIGRLVIGLLKRHDLNLYVFDPFLSEAQAAELGVAKAGIEHIFRNCDVISNHVADNENTKGIVTYGLLSSMKDYATFINTGRGAQIESGALLRAMSEKPGRTALLDVTDPQEPLPAGSPYFSCGNIFVTPHRAGSVQKEVLRMGKYMFEEYARVASGEAALYEVNMRMLETMA